jgi:hypothetical protein
MAECAICGFWIVCPEGCAIVCDGDCNNCHAECFPSSGKARETESGRLASAAELKVCTKEAPRDWLIDVLQHALGARLESTRDDMPEQVDFHFTGPVDDLLSELGLERSS